MFRTALIAKETFSVNNYDTPKSRHRFIGDYLFFQSRWWFLIRFAGIVFKSSHLARKGLYDDNQWIGSSFNVFRNLEGCGATFHIEGLDNIRKTERPMVIVSNHMSTLETVVFPGLIAPYRRATFVVKDTLVKGPVFGPVMRSRNPIVVGRQDPRADLKTVMDEGVDRLNKGFSLIIFPQSTRTLEFDPKKFNSLGVKLAARAGVDILPMAIKTDFWGDSRILKGFGPLYREKVVNIVFGDPFPIKGNGKEEHQRIVEFITSHLEKWGAIIRQS